MVEYTVEHNQCELLLRKKYNLCQLPLSKKYRSHFEIIASILEAAKCSSGDRYFLMKHTSANYAQLKKYLESLNRLGFIEIRMRDQQILYCATEKGLEFLKQYYILLGMLTNPYAPSRQGQLIYQTAYAAFKKPKNSNENSLSEYAK